MKTARTLTDTRLKRRSGPTLGGHTPHDREMRRNAIISCGWGRLIFAHTFDDPDGVVADLRKEARGKRDIAFYVTDPHVLLAKAPQELFLDPSDTYRLWLPDYRPSRRREKGFVITPARLPEDLRDINRIYKSHRMMPIDRDTLPDERTPQTLVILVARDAGTQTIVGVAMGVDHVHAFNDPEGGSSLWSLAVDAQCRHPRVGEALTRRLAERFKAHKREFMDLSVMHDNTEAIRLYRKLGFQKVPVFAVKTRSSINEELYTGPDITDQLNIYAEIIVDEARRRGIAVEILDAEHGYFRLEFGGRTIVCRESLSELTTAVAMSRCDNKEVTSRILRKAGLRVPEQTRAGSARDDADFLARHGEVVVKPVSGEQGKGVTVGVTSPEELKQAVEEAGRIAEPVLIEECLSGDDLRLVVIDNEVVAAAVRRPPEVTGNGRDTIAQLIRRQSRRREAASRGESHIPLDRQTESCVAAAGWSLDDVLPEGQTLTVRRTANLHTGGTIEDVTPRLNPSLAEAGVRAARALEIPVAGVDLIVPSVEGADYAIVEVNERPGLANHEPQPTAERFIDLLFPQTVSR